MANIVHKVQSQLFSIGVCERRFLSQATVLCILEIHEIHSSRGDKWRK